MHNLNGAMERRLAGGLAGERGSSEGDPSGEDGGSVPQGRGRGGWTKGAGSMLCLEAWHGEVPEHRCQVLAAREHARTCQGANHLRGVADATHSRGRAGSTRVCLLGGGWAPMPICTASVDQQGIHHHTCSRAPMSGPAKGPEAPRARCKVPALQTWRQTQMSP